MAAGHIATFAGRVFLSQVCYNSVGVAIPAWKLGWAMAKFFKRDFDTYFSTEKCKMQHIVFTERN
jgi:hypothetical protein